MRKTVQTCSVVSRIANHHARALYAYCMHACLSSSLSVGVSECGQRVRYINVIKSIAVYTRQQKDDLTKMPLEFVTVNDNVLQLLGDEAPQTRPLPGLRPYRPRWGLPFP